MREHDVMELGADAGRHPKRQESAGCGSAPEGASKEASEALQRSCATCVNRCTHTPMRCGLLHDETGRTRLCHVARMPGGPCGPEGAFWRQADDGVSNVILFPGERRYEGLPKAGSFDGGSAA